MTCACVVHARAVRVCVLSLLCSCLSVCVTDMRHAMSMPRGWASSTMAPVGAVPDVPCASHSECTLNSSGASVPCAAITKIRSRSAPSSNAVDVQYGPQKNDEDPNLSKHYRFQEASFAKKNITSKSSQAFRFVVCVERESSLVDNTIPRLAPQANIPPPGRSMGAAQGGHLMLK